MRVVDTNGRALDGPHIGEEGPGPQDVRQEIIGRRPGIMPLQFSGDMPQMALDDSDPLGIGEEASKI